MILTLLYCLYDLLEYSPEKEAKVNEEENVAIPAIEAPLSWSYTYNRPAPVFDTSLSIKNLIESSKLKKIMDDVKTQDKLKTFPTYGPLTVHSSNIILPKSLPFAKYTNILKNN